MNAKLVLGLAAVTAIVTVGAVAAVYDRYENRGPSRLNELMVPSLLEKANDVSSITVKDAKGSFSLNKAGTAWVIPEKGGYPATEDKVRKAIVDLAKLRKVEEKTRLKDRLTRLQLEDPSGKDAKSVLVSVKAGDRAVASLIVGKRKISTTGKGGDGVYVRMPDRDQAWLAEGDYSVATDALDWLDKIVLDVKESRVNEVQVLPRGGEQIIAVRDEGAGKGFKLSNVPADKTPVKEAGEKLRDLASAFDGLEIADVKKAGDLAGKEPDLTLTLSTADGLVVDLAGFRDGEALWFAIAAMVDDASASGEKDRNAVRAEAEAINAEVKGWLYKFPDYKTKNLTPDMASLAK